MTKPFSIFVLLLAGLFTGCNVFEGFYEPGTSDDPAVLVEDADIALQQGEPQKAVAFLQKAVENDPDNVRARAKLTVAHLRAQNVDVLTLQNLIDDFRTTNAAGKTSGALQVCRYTPAPGLTTTPIDYRISSEYTRLLGVVSALQAAQANGIQLLDAITQSFGENLSPTQFGTAAARAQLFNSIANNIRTQNGVAEAVARQETAAFLIAFGLSEFTLSILDLDGDVTANQIQWVRLKRNGQDAGFSICAPTQANIDAMAAAVACEVPQLRSGGIALRTRAENLGSRNIGGSNDQALALEVADEADAFIADFEAEFPAAACSG